MEKKRISKVYTGVGDQGKTQLVDGSWVEKSDPRIHVLGTIDELNSLLGVVRTLNLPKDVQDELETLQNLLFVLGADIGAPSDIEVPRIQSRHVQWLEARMDTYLESLGPLKEFILPGGSLEASLLYLARTIARRAERFATPLLAKQEIRSTAYTFLNRLSDYLFVLARWVNHEKGFREPYVKFPEERGNGTSRD